MSEERVFRRRTSVPPALEAFIRLDEGINFSGLAREGIKRRMRLQGVQTDVQRTTDAILNHPDLEFEEVLEEVSTLDGFCQLTPDDLEEVSSAEELADMKPGGLA